MKVIHDTPLTDISNDRFGREPIVDLIVNSINQVVGTVHPCIVYGIYGKWGEGKTSMMNFVKSKLVAQGENDGIVIAEFNPWLVNNDEALLQEFFKTIIADADDVVREVFRKYGSLAIFASKTIVNAVAPGFGSALARGIKWAQKALEDSKESLSILKKKASDAIIKSKKHLIVMIDDVDRLDKEELHAVMRLIRQVADFDNCIYIVAMDVDMVAKSIADYHGNGSHQDGRKFIDKIVQVPILLPPISHCDMRKLLEEDLSKTLKDAVDGEQLAEITETVLAFINTYRDVKRFCNQLSFVLPHVKGEVNIHDLCALEVIKMVSPEAYSRIYESENSLRHIVSAVPLMTEDLSHEETEKKYVEAKGYVCEGMNVSLKEVVMNTLDFLFNSSCSFGNDDIDKKRLDTDVYFPKYFTQLVPSNLIPDRLLDDFHSRFFELSVEEIAGQFDEWLEKYSPAEIKRASLYFIHNSADRNEINSAASVIAKALSISKLAKGLPPHISVDSEAIPAFVSISIILGNMFFQDTQSGLMNVWDEKLLDETLAYIFEKSEMNFCLNFFCSADSDIFGKSVYDGRNVCLVLIRRFIELGFEGQFKYSKFLLVTLLGRWKRVDVEGYNKYAKNLFANTDISFSLVLDKFIDGLDDGQDVVNFVGLFKLQIPLINERLQVEDEDVKNSHAAKIYAANYKGLLRQ